MKSPLLQRAEAEEYRPGLWDWVAASMYICLLLGPLAVPWLLGYRP